MSTALRAPEQPNSKLYKSSQGLGGGSRLTRNQLSTKPINLQRSGLASSSVNVSHSRQVEPEYRKQLIELHQKLKEALQHSIQEINKIKSALNTMQDKSFASPSPVPHAKMTAADVESSFLYKRHKRSRIIKFPENDEELNGYVDASEATNPFFASLLDKAQASKLKTVKVPAFPFKRYDEYKGPKLIEIFADFQKKYKGTINTKDLASQQTQFKQVFQTAPEPQRVPAQRQPVEERKVDLSGRAPTSLGDSKVSVEDLKDKKTGFMDFSLSSKRETESGDKPKGPSTPSSLFGGTVPGAKKDETAGKEKKDPTTATALKEKEEPKAAGEKKEAALIIGSGQPAQTGKPASSLFGGVTVPKDKEEAKSPAEKKEAASIFGGGQPAQTGKPASSLFGGAKEEPKAAGEKKEAASIFGSGAPPIQTGKAPSVLFGGAAAKEKTESTAQQSTATSSQLVGKKKEEEEKKNEDGDKSSSFIDSEDEGGADMGTILDKPPKTKQDKKEAKETKDILQSLPGVKLSSNFSFAPDPKKDLLKDIINEGGVSDDDIPAAPTLVRDDSYLNKSEPAPKVDFFKTMTGRPPFLPPKGEKKEDSLAQLRDFKNLTDKGPITLFTKKIEDKPKQAEEKKEQGLSSIPENADDDNILDSLSLGQPKKQTPAQQTQQTKPPLDLTGGQKAPIISQPVNQQAGQDKPQQTVGSFFGSNPAQPANPVEQKPLTTSNWGFLGGNKDQNQPAQPGFGMSNQQAGGQNPFQAKPNMFAISTNKDNTAGQNQGSTGPTFGVSQFGSGGSGGFPAFGGGTANAFAKPPAANPMGSGFGHTSSFGSNQPQAPKISAMPQTTKLFGSGGASSTGNMGANAGASSTGSSGGMLFSSAIQNTGSTGFLGGGGSNQPNVSFGGKILVLIQDINGCVRKYGHEFN